MAVVGGYLPVPEAGWTRFNDDDSSILYINGNSSWGRATESGTWKDDYHSVGGGVSQDCRNSKVRFNFTGTSLRLIGYTYNLLYRSDKIAVTIDGIDRGWFSQSADPLQMRLDYEVTNLSGGEHCVDITVINVGGYTFDAVDVMGQLKPYNPNLKKNQCWTGGM